MTINVALATYDAIVLGCDSLSSVRTPYLRIADFARDGEGKFMTDGAGNLLMPFTADRIVSPTTSVFGGVSKMFCLFADPGHDCVVGAVTAGQAILNGVTIAALAHRFKRSHARDACNSVEVVAKEFLAFMRGEWERDTHFSELGEGARTGLTTVQFLIGGFGGAVEHGQIFRVDVKTNSCVEQFPSADHTGVCWAGTADHAERLIRGVAQEVRSTVTRQIKEALDAQRTSLLKSVSDSLATQNVTLPEGFTLEVEETFAPSFGWDVASADVGYGNLPLQYGVDFVSLLVNTQSGMMRFSRGIPTVGGRTHIGVVRRGEPFHMLNKAKLVHKNVGYADDV